MQPKKRALGKGLGALLPVSVQAPKAEQAQPETADKSFMRLALTELYPNPSQPRVTFNEEALQELADSIKQSGLIQPLAVTPRSGKYMIVAGERRWRAAQTAGLTHVPVLVLEISDEQVLEYALVENLQRENLNPIEEARGYNTLMTSFGLVQEEVAERVGKSRSAVANALRLLTLPKEIVADVEAGRLTSGHARALLSIEDEWRRTWLRNMIVERGLSVREAERMATEPEAAPKKKGSYGRRKLDSDTAALRERLIEALACRVDIKTVDGQRGKIEISYNSLDELERVLNVLGVQL